MNFSQGVDLSCFRTDTSSYRPVSCRPIFSLMHFARFKQLARLSVISTLLVNGLFFSATTSFAQTYSWTDSSGNTVYGTTPPKAATDVKQFKTKNLSRYSSNKVLERLGWRASLKKPKPVADESENFNSALKLPVVGSETSSSTIPAQLEHGAISLGFADTGLSRDVSSSVTKCEVTVSNLGAKLATDVNVAFEFDDGSLIPATGPAQIASGKTETYVVPDGLLPLEIILPEVSPKPEKNSAKNKDSEGIDIEAQQNPPAIMPKVFMHGITPR